jgi:hypothetical protein
MQGKFHFSKEYKINEFLFSSEFVTTRVIQDLYQLCCSKRFTPNAVEKLAMPPRTTLYKYLVIPKEGQPQPPPPPPPPASQIKQPKTPDYETRPATNPFAQHPMRQPSSSDQHPPEIKRRISHNSAPTEHGIRQRSGTLPFLEHTEPLEHISTMRSGNGIPITKHVYHPKHDEQQVQEEEEEGQ